MKKADFIRFFHSISEKISLWVHKKTYVAASLGLGASRVFFIRIIYGLPYEASECYVLFVYHILCNEDLAQLQETSDGRPFYEFPYLTFLSETR